MKNRLKIIQESVQSIISEVLDTEEKKRDMLKRAEAAKKQADKDALKLAKQGYGVDVNPPEHEFIRQNDARYYRMANLVSKLRGRLAVNEDMRHPDQVRADMDYHIEKRGWIPPQLHTELKQSMIAYGELPPEKKKRPKKETQNPTNESVLKELYSFSGLYARAIGIKPRELTDKEKEEGQNPWLTPEGKTIYPTGPLARILGKKEYVDRGIPSVNNLLARGHSLKDSTERMIRKSASGEAKGLQTPEEITAFAQPRLAQLDRLVKKMSKRNARVNQAATSALSSLRSMNPPPPPTDHYG